MIKVYLILISILFFNKFSFTQKIEPGKYVSVWKYDHFSGETFYNSEYGEEFTFRDSINFIYRYRDDITDNRGTGIYTQGKKFLNLEISGNSADFDTSNYKILDTSFSKSENILINIDTRDKYDVLYGARITVSSSGNEILRTSSDENGKTRFKVSKKLIPILIKISYIGYGHTYINFSSQLNAKIVVTMDRPFSIIKEKKSITYRIKDIDLDGFYAKGGIFSEWTFFKRED